MHIIHLPYKQRTFISKMNTKKYQKNKMQLGLADLAAGAATWRPVRNIRVVFDSGFFGPL